MSVPTVASVEAAVAPAGVNFADPVALLGYAMKVIGQVEVLSDLSDADKSTFIVNAVKTAINGSTLTADEKVIALTWCDAALPHVIQAVAMVKADAKKVEATVVADVQKCCPSWFSKA